MWVPYGEARDPGRGRLGRADRGERAARVRAGPVRPPAVRPVLLGHDRAAEADRARPRRPADRAPQEPGARLGPQARRPPAVVLDHRVDDVERARRGAAAALVDRDARRRPRLARPARAVAAGRGAPAVGDGRRARVPDGVPQGRDPARARVRPEQHPHAVHGGLAAPAGGLPVRVRAARPEDAAEQRLGRDRRVHRASCPGSFAQPVYEGEITGPCLGRRRARVRPRGQRGDRRARRARDHPADAVDAGRALGRRGRRALPLVVLRRVPGRLAPGRLDHVHRARQLRHHRALRRDAEPRRRAARHRRVLRGRRGRAGGHRRARRAPRGRRRRRRRAAPVRRAGATARELDDALRERIAARAAQRAVAAPRARHDRRRSRRSRGRSPARSSRRRSSGSCAASPPSASPAATRWPTRRRSTRSSRSAAERSIRGRRALVSGDDDALQSERTRFAATDVASRPGGSRAGALAGRRRRHQAAARLLVGDPGRDAPRVRGARDRPHSGATSAAPSRAGRSAT